MLIPLKEVINKYNLNIKGVVQVGAHWAEEHSVYVELGIKNIVYIEPCAKAVDMLGLKFGSPSELHPDIKVQVLNCACADYVGEMDMHVSHDNQGQSNSLLKPKLHLQQHPEVRFTDTERVIVVTLDSLHLLRENYNLLMLDVQGAEGMVLKGATETLKYIDVIYTECNRGQTYSGNMEIDEMDALLFGHGFLRKETHWPSKNWTWGDAVYIKDDTWFNKKIIIE